ncbi:MAG: hypothetical protein FJ088_08535, partial [Deltaproteobacteria bacterium]|nr:hypothetical protein [Deltaproteobacteria bacterium]
KYERVKAFSNWFLYWIGENRRTTPNYDKYIAGTFKPSYDAVMGNAGAAGYKPPVIIFGGISCDHIGKVGDNPLYKGIGLEGCTQDYGCSFCTMFRGQVSDVSADPLTAAEEQLRRSVETSGSNGRFSGIYNVYDIRLFRQIDRFFEMIFRIGLPPAVFCFEPRIELFLETAGMVASLLPAIEKSGHVLSISGMGAENLVYEENLIFNKDVGIGQIDRTSGYLKEFSERYPGTFRCNISFSYITCSPWTTLEMLETGTSRGIERNFDPLGDWLYSPLLLFHGAPVTRLAENEDNIILKRHEELSLLYKPVVNEIDIGSFVPWRFKDGRTDAAFSLIVRFCAAALRNAYPDLIFHGDGLYTRILDYGASGGSFERPDLFAVKTIAAVKEAIPPYDREKILRSSLDSYAASVTPAGKKNSRKKRVLTHMETESRAQKMDYLIKAVIENSGKYFKDVAAIDLKESYEESVIHLEIAVGGSNYRLFLLDPSGIDECLFRSEHFAVCSARETPIKSDNVRKKIVSLVRVFDRALTKYAPEILP